jgi:Minor capsid.
MANKYIDFEEYFKSDDEDSGSYAVGMKFHWNYSNEEIIRRKGFGKELNLYMARTAASYFERYVPYRSGRLNNSVRCYASKEAGRIVYTAKYAEAQYLGPKWWNRNRRHHPLATSEWDKVGWQNHGTTVINKVDKERIRLSKERSV